MATRKTAKLKSKPEAPAVVPAVASPTTIMLGLIVAFIVGVVLLELRPILLPFVIALFFSIIFSPVVTALRERRVPTVLALAVVLLSMALLLSLLSLVVYSSADSFAREMPKYERRLTGMVESIGHTITQAAADLDISLEEIHWRQAFQLSSLTGAVTSGLGSFFNFLTNLILILLFMMFMLAGSGQLGEKIRRAFPQQQADRFARIIENVGRQVRQYLITKTLISLATGGLTYLVLLLTGVDFPLIWGTLAFLLNFIPNIGSMIAVALPVILSFVQFDTPGRPLLVLILLATIQAGMGQVIEPRWMASRLNLSALVVLVSLMFWGWLWGAWGMILAVPIMASVKIAFENLETLRPISMLMSGGQAPQ
jgi:AI-2 transport protein TqsA